MTMAQKYRKKLIEVALPLEAINKASIREKEPFTRHHPRSIHVWWARLTLAACRAVLFSSLVDDPSEWPELFLTEEDQEAERKRLFDIIEQLVKWKNSNNEIVILMAQTEIARSIARNLGDEMPKGAQAIREYLAEKAPPVLDPFCGGGSIPLEAQRLGLRAYGSDLNPVAVLITKALIEIPPKFAGLPPVNPEAREEKRLTEKDWKGAEGLAEDVRYYGKWMRDEAEKRIGHLYPRVKITEEMAKDRADLKPYAGQELTVIAWLWARTVQCPNPGCGARTPLLRSFWLSKKKGKEAYLQPVIDSSKRNISGFEVLKDGQPMMNTTDRTGARCLFCDAFIKKPQLREIAIEYGIEPIPTVIVAEGNRERVYLSSDAHDIPNVEKLDAPFLEQPLANDKRWFSPPSYGMPNFADLFTNRQLVALTTFSDLVQEAREKVLEDSGAVEELPDDDRSIDAGGNGPTAYADALVTYLALSVARWSDMSNTICSWNTTNQNIRALFARQAIPMSWDFAELSPFSQLAPIESTSKSAADVIEQLPASRQGSVTQLNATQAIQTMESIVVSTDPPYYDNIGYADLSDFFYIWLRRSLSSTYPQLFATLLTPKVPELIANPCRHDGSKKKAGEFFEEGLVKAFSFMPEAQNESFPLTVYYAFKQAESGSGDAVGVGVSTKDTATASTGWETMLTGLIGAGFSILGTWPMRLQRTSRSVGLRTNALASSIVLTCRIRVADAPMATRREFLSALKDELPKALTNLQHGNIAPVDLAQASIGPGMAVFTRYSKVMESNGSPMSVRAALGLINQTLDEVLAEQEGEFDPDTRWAIAWFDQFGMEEGLFGVAETLSKAKNTAINGLVEAGILEARAGKVRLLKRDELSKDWDPARDKRFTVWEAAQYLVRALDQQGEQGAADLFQKLGGLGETARDLAYRLYNICERKKWAQEALAYNSLVIAWPEITRLAYTASAEGYGPQTGLFENE